MPNVDIPQGIDTGGCPRRQETMGGTSAKTRSERVLEQPNKPPLIEGHTSGSEEGRLEENIKLTDTVPTPHDSPLTVTQLENELSTTKSVYNKAFITLTNKVKKLESQLKQKRSSSVIHSSDEEGPSVHIEDSLKQGKIIKEMDKDKNFDLGARQDQERYNLEKALELQRQLDQRKENVPKGDQVKEIDWNDPQVLRYHALQNRPFSKAKVRKNMIMYLKNQGGIKFTHLYPKDSEIEREVMKRAGFDLQQGSLKKQRLDQQTEETEEEAEVQGDTDQEVEELKLYMRIIPKKDIAIEAIPLVIKPLVIIEYKIVKEGKISNYHITKADGSTRRYTLMINLLKNNDREDLETLWNLVKEKYGNIRPKEGWSAFCQIQKFAHLPAGG
nr:hypothetical protein [Tanacetum cinerariifolium]